MFWVRREDATLKLKRQDFLQILLLIFLSMLFYWVLSHLSEAGALLGKVFSVLTPLLAGGAIAFVCSVPLRQIEKLWDRFFHKKPAAPAAPNPGGAAQSSAASKSAAQSSAALSGPPAPDGFKRAVCLTLTLVLVLGLLSAVFLIVIPELEQTVSEFAERLPEYSAQIEKWWTNLMGWLEERGIQLPPLELDEERLGAAIEKYVTERGHIFVNETVNITTSIVSTVVDIFLSLVVSVYMLAQKEKLARQARMVVVAFLPEKRAESLLSVASLSSRIFSSFVTGQLTEAMILGLLCFLGMTIFGFPYAPVIAALIGVTALVPIFGALIGTVVGAFLILLSDPMQAVWFVIFLQVLQQIEGNLIYPRVVGKSVGLPGLWVLLSVTIGGSAFGVLGMLLSVPTCSVLYTLLSRAVHRRLEEKEENA